MRPKEVARGPLCDQVVPSPVFIKPSASPPNLNDPRIKDCGFRMAAAFRNIGLRHTYRLRRHNI